MKALDDQKNIYRYCVHFDKVALDFLLGMNGVTAIKVTPATNTNGELSMKIEAYVPPKKTPVIAETDSKKKADDQDSSSTQAKSMMISAPQGASFIAITPCPPYCGFKDDYVY